MGCVDTTHFVLWAEGCMSSGGSKVSFMKPHKSTEENHRPESLKDKDIKLQNNIARPDNKIKEVSHPLANKSSSLESSNQLHHYARSLVMVQR